MRFTIYKDNLYINRHLGEFTISSSNHSSTSIKGEVEKQGQKVGKVSLSSGVCDSWGVQPEPKECQAPTYPGHISSAEGSTGRERGLGRGWGGKQGPLAHCTLVQLEWQPDLGERQKPWLL